MQDYRVKSKEDGLFPFVVRADSHLHAARQVARRFECGAVLLVWNEREWRGGLSPREYEVIDPERGVLL